MLLQSRGHYLTGGEREKQFNLFKPWAYSMAVFPSGFGTNPTRNALSLKPVKSFAVTCWHCWQKLMFGVASVTTS